MKNSGIYLETKRKEMLGTIIDFLVRKERYDFGVLQLKTAIEKGKEGYDDERFMKNKKPVSVGLHQGWPRDWPKSVGKYWLSGYPQGMNSIIANEPPVTILCEVVPIANGSLNVVGDGCFIYPSEAVDVWFQEAIIPERPEES